METIREVVVKVMTTDGKTVKVGDTVEFTAYGRINKGIFTGIGGRGAYLFVGSNQLSDVEFSVMPRAIERMYLANPVFVGNEV